MYMTSGYIDPNATVIRNLHHLFAKSISMFGVVVWRLQDKYDHEFYETVPLWVSRGELKYREHIFDGLEKIDEALLALKQDNVHGKLAIRVASDEV